MSEMIPDSVRSRLQKLLALANDASANENMAAMASAKVQAMLAEYNLEMSQVGGEAEGVLADATREKAGKALETKWQSTLFVAIAENNFCLRWRETHDANGHAYADPVYSLIGRKVNIATTLQVYEYLAQAVERICPQFTGMKSKAARSWKEGCADRLRDRLLRQRQDSEASSRAARNEGPRGNGSDLVLADVYSSEDDLNRDYRFGKAPGTTARETAENELRWAAMLAAACEAEKRDGPAPAPAPSPKKAETAAQRCKREERDAAQSARLDRKWERERRLEAAKVDQAAYDMGREAGAQISLNKQITEERLVAIAG